ncbi:GNAT family N-acetyltransferase [Actinomadura namibiensis]|uniref:RimJ/RimL family protein N-acetyltransferase n=1 Tax=Actinomadura namibiensis TaxID=182080 RepID=A0A7W3QRS3_ACTNM|nr:GNAT family N-acetyltransferase [Actinomadura namibiensis]MBA8956907.1 RimJ/RimL family protein N-acetyltransferase [Actinomadura namibiensis]
MIKNSSRRMRLVEMTPQAMSALAAGDTATASAEAGVPLTEHFVGDGLRALWRYRAGLRETAPDRPQGRVWAVVSEPEGVVVGHGGFQAPPDDEGTIEISYSVDPAARRQGWGKVIATELLHRAADEGARTVRASVAPDNTASLAVITALGFHRTGERWDEEDGRELVFERLAHP